LANVNGVEAFICFDTGSEVDAMTQEFANVAKLSFSTKQTPLRLRLATKGSLAQTSYEVQPVFDFGNSQLRHDIDIVNLDRWDVILGSPFCNQYGVVLNFKDRTVSWDGITIKALTSDEEAAVKGQR
ncbi:hypothetical protein DL93DRAFT_2033215, partial [Clavulina sp. PMI_390]